MDPLAQAMQLLQEAQQIIAMQAEEIQALRQQSGGKQQSAEPMQKKASMEKLAMVTGLRQEELPSFIKEAGEDELRDFMSTIESRARFNTMGKIAEIYDGSQAETPEERLEASLSNLMQ